MATRSLNKVLLIGNLTRDPELRYTPQGTAVCTFGLATNRQWATDEGEKKEEAEFHNVVAWNRLAEICAEYLNKGKACYVEGRIATRDWEGQDGTRHKRTEIVANEVIFLGGGRAADLEVPAELGEVPSGTSLGEVPSEEEEVKPKKEKKAQKEDEEEGEQTPF